MDRDTQTSFIPKSALTRAPERIPQVVSLPVVIAIFFFIISLGLYGGSYAYRSLLDRSINSPCSANGQSCGLKESINRARRDLDQATTVYLQRLDDKLAIGSQVVGEHRTTLPLFTLLEDLTLPTIYYTRLTYAKNTFTIEGRASSYEDIAVQTSIFSRERSRIKSFIFSDLDLDSTGAVVFKLVLNVEPSVTSYAADLDARSSAPAVASSTVTSNLSNP